MTKLEFLNNLLNTEYKSLNDVPFGNVSWRSDIDENFIRIFKDYVYWDYLSHVQYFSEDFIREFKDKLNLRVVTYHSKLSEDFIREFKDDLDWLGLSYKQHLSSAFIDEFKDNVKWLEIARFQTLSENDIRKHKDRINWQYVSKFQKLSEEFINEFKDFVYWPAIQEYQNLSEDFRKLHNLRVSTNNWLYKDELYKKTKITQSGIYECYGNYFIAYKSIRRDRYSHFNVQHKYLKNNVYEAHADHTKRVNSFGINAWTKDLSKQYRNELVVSCKIYYNDVAYFNQYTGEIRCRKIQILE